MPQAGKPTFDIADDEMEMGMGIHGEPGVWRDKLRPADAIADEMMDRLLADMPLAKGDRVSVLVNSLGATPPEELYILYRVVKARLEAAGATIVMPLVGRYATSMEMAGVSFTLCKLDAELEALLDRALRLRVLEGGMTHRPRRADSGAIARLTAAMERDFDMLNTADGALGRRRSWRDDDARDAAGHAKARRTCRTISGRRCWHARRPSPSRPGRPTAR